MGGNLCRRRLIFPGGCPPSIVSTSELNYRVRNGNGWTLIVIGTDSIFNAFNVKSIYILHRFRAVFFGDPYGIRTHVTAVKGPCLNHLTNGPYNTRDAFASRAFGSGTWIRTGDTSGMNRMLWPTELCRHILPDRTRDSITGRRSVCQ